MLPQYIVFKSWVDMDCGLYSLQHALEVLEIDGVKPYHLEKKIEQNWKEYVKSSWRYMQISLEKRPTVLYALDTDKFTPI